jgi:hypothetical protein
LADDGRATRVVAYGPVPGRIAAPIDDRDSAPIGIEAGPGVARPGHYGDVANAVDDLVQWVQQRPNTVLEPGLSDEELSAAQSALAIEFPVLWTDVLRVVLPVDGDASQDKRAWPDWPDWRLRNFEHVHLRVHAPIEGLLFDVENSDFWWQAWGPMPDSPTARLRVAHQRLAEVPRLVPIYGHQYVATASSSPVFSIVQADLWMPAITLADLPLGRDQEAVPMEDWPIGGVPFWSELHAYGQAGHMDERFAGLGRGDL